MRRFVVGAVGAMGVLGVWAASAVAFSAPPEARFWLGTWHTNQGEVIFNSLSDCRHFNDGTGNLGCTLDGKWHQPVESAGFGGTRVAAGWKAIQGTVLLGPKYRGLGWEGCFHVPGEGRTPPGERCSDFQDGAILIDRDGDRFTEGFWKACALSEICTDHHPFLGKKVGGCAPAPDRRVAHAATCGGPETVRFSFKVDGFPDRPTEKDLPRDLATVEIRSENTELSWDPEEKRWVPHGTLQMTTTYVNPITQPHIHEYQTTFSLDPVFSGRRTERNEASYFQSPAKKIVRFQAEISQTYDDLECGPGTRWWISLAVAKKRAAVKLEWIESDGGRECLTGKPMIWDLHRIKFATISAPR